MTHTTHGKNIQKKNKARGKLRKSIARELGIRRFELTSQKMILRLLQRKENAITARNH